MKFVTVGAYTIDRDWVTHTRLVDANTDQEKLVVHFGTPDVSGQLYLNLFGTDA